MKFKKFCHCRFRKDSPLMVEGCGVALGNQNHKRTGGKLFAPSACFWFGSVTVLMEYYLTSIFSTAAFPFPRVVLRIAI